MRPSGSKQEALWLSGLRMSQETLREFSVGCTIVKTRVDLRIALSISEASFVSSHHFHLRIGLDFHLEAIARYCVFSSPFFSFDFHASLAQLSADHGPVSPRSTFLSRQAVNSWESYVFEASGPSHSTESMTGTL